jgi:hypothetical protein
MVESVDSSVPDTPMVNNNQGQSKYGCMYRRTTHYDPMTGHTIGTEATALANYYQCCEVKTWMARWNLPMLEPV